MEDEARPPAQISSAGDIRPWVQVVAPMQQKSRMFGRIGYRLLAVGFGIAGAVVLAEIGARLTAPQGPFDHNPIIKKQAGHVGGLFEDDPELGHRLKDGAFIGVYAGGLITLSDIEADPLRQDRLVVLSLGDSSTSGWNSDVVTENAERIKRGLPLRSPFGTYRTYSDVLAEDPLIYVINAGIPGFTSLQGLHYLSRLLDAFEDKGIRINVVTVYFGNNDSTWNGNIEDKYVIPNSGIQLHLARVYSQNIKRGRIVRLRVSVPDFKKSLSAIIALARDRDIETVLIKPPVPRMWPPGVRASGRQSEVPAIISKYRDDKAGQELAEATRFFHDAMRLLRTDEKKATLLLDQARERDFIVPRIKQVYEDALRSVARAEGVPLVSVDALIPLRDRRFFIDYCHPSELANREIAATLLQVMKERLRVFD